MFSTMHGRKALHCIGLGVFLRMFVYRLPMLDVWGIIREPSRRLSGPITLRTREAEVSSQDSGEADSQLGHDIPTLDRDGRCCSWGRGIKSRVSLV